MQASSKRYSRCAMSSINRGREGIRGLMPEPFGSIEEEHRTRSLDASVSLLVTYCGSFKTHEYGQVESCMRRTDYCNSHRGCPRPPERLAPQYPLRQQMLSSRDGTFSFGRRTGIYNAAPGIDESMSAVSRAQSAVWEAR